MCIENDGTGRITQATGNPKFGETAGERTTGSNETTPRIACLPVSVEESSVMETVADFSLAFTVSFEMVKCTQKLDGFGSTPIPCNTIVNGKLSSH